MDITIQSRIHPNRRHKLIAINHGTHYEIKYPGEDRPMLSPVMLTLETYMYGDSTREALEAKVRVVCEASGNVFEVVPTAPRAREVTLFIVGGVAHAIRVDRMDRANRYTRFNPARLKRIMRVIERNNVPVLLAID